MPGPYTTAAAFLQDVRDLVSTALFGFPGQGAMVSDYSSGDSDSFTAGETKYQCRLWVVADDERSESNTVYTSIGVEVQVFHAMQSRTSEPAYTSGPMLTAQADLLELDTWRGIVGVFDLAENPQIDSTPSLAGNVLSYRLDLIARIVTNPSA